MVRRRGPRTDDDISRSSNERSKESVKVDCRVPAPPEKAGQSEAHAAPVPFLFYSLTVVTRSSFLVSTPS
uniref:Uncharacterized protein n=1 Tax=Vespula pensylvanica TaxID=30213 RepID=A0A834PD58_VESPE|nr:hypothetical protein H0235_003944 [Vespula pensylvanica]